MPLQDLRSQATRRTPEAMLEHLKSFHLDLKFSAGIWFFSPSASRFHDKYQPEIDIPQRLELAASLKDYGLTALEAHYPSEVNEENAPLWQQFSRDTGIRIIAANPFLFWDAQFEWGSLSNPLEAPRQAAMDRAKRCLQFNKDLGTEFMVIWPGIDGYEQNFGLDFVALRARYAEGLAQALDAVPGVRVAIEPKPYEPRGHIIYGTTSEAMLLAHQVEGMLQNPENTRLLAEGHALCCLNPEVGHVLMGYEDLPYAYSWPLSEGRLAHTHWNSQPLGNYDQDLNVSALSPEQTEALLYTMKMYGYRGYFGLDINPERMPVTQAIKNSIDAIRAANDRIDNLDHESILCAHQRPDQGRGWLEAYLIRARAPQPNHLPPLPPLP